MLIHTVSHCFRERGVWWCVVVFAFVGFSLLAAPAFAGDTNPFLAENVGRFTGDNPDNECPAGTRLECEEDQDWSDWKSKKSYTKVDGIDWSEDLEKYWQDKLKREGSSKQERKEFDFNGQVCRCAETPVTCPSSYTEIDDLGIWKDKGFTKDEMAKRDADVRQAGKLHCYINPFADSSADQSVMAGHFHDPGGGGNHFFNWTGNLIFDLGEDYSSFACMCGVYRGDGCFSPDAKLTLADGTTKRAAEVRVGDMLWNPSTESAVEVLKVVEGSEEIPLIEFGYDDVTTTVTTEHPVLTAKGVKRARELSLNDEIFDSLGKARPLTRLVRAVKTEGQYVVNFITNPGETDPARHMLLSDGIITGNLVLQNQLAE